MAEEALALSPVPVSPAPPSDADYQAIRDVFMETERGRWFLAEYAKRNRNADTAMVLEAVARIEQNMAAQAEAAASVSEALPELARTALDQARVAIHREFSETGFDPVLLSWRKSARIIREIVWGLREVGADPRICNILDGQVRAIEAACDEFPLADIRDRILAALDAAVPQDEIAAPKDAADTDAAAEIVADEALAQAADLQTSEIEPEPAEAMAAEAPVMEAAIVEAAPAETALVEAAAVETSVTETTAIEITIADIALIEPDIAEADPVMEVAAPLPAEPAPPAPVTTSSDEPAPDIAIVAETIAEDIAEPVTASVAATPEMLPPAPAAAVAAPRSIMTASAAQPDPQPMAEPAASDAPSEIIAASLPETSPAELTPEIAAPVVATEASEPENNLWADIESEIAPLPPLDPAHEASLGASLIAQGLVKRPSKDRADLLAPIRRMSHAERIAFFS